MTRHPDFWAFVALAFFLVWAVFSFRALFVEGVHFERALPIVQAVDEMAKRAQP